MSERTALATGIAVAAVLGAAGVALVAPSSRRLRNNRKGVEMAKQPSEPVWPIPRDKLNSIHQSVLAHRPGTNRPHKGVDLMADAGTQVLSATSGTVLRIIDGSKGDTEGQRRAGLWVDVKGRRDGRIYRYLHLGQALTDEGARIKAGDVVGIVGKTGESGVLHSSPHLHFEIRDGDWDPSAKDYGTPLDPLSLLPLRLLPVNLRRSNA